MLESYGIDVDLPPVIDHYIERNQAKNNFRGVFNGIDFLQKFFTAAQVGHTLNITALQAR